jgi:hypothetical protein
MDNYCDQLSWAWCMQNRNMGDIVHSIKYQALTHLAWSQVTHMAGVRFCGSHGVAYRSHCITYWRWPEPAGFQSLPLHAHKWGTLSNYRPLAAGSATTSCRAGRSLGGRRSHLRCCRWEPPGDDARAAPQSWLAGCHASTWACTARPWCMEQDLVCC